MEFLNKIELQGIVGYVHGTTFSLVVEEIGEDIIDAVWFNCRGAGEVKLSKGDWVNVKGRMRGHSSQNVVTYDVIVKELTIL